MEQIQITARFPKIDPANLDEFKALAADMMAITRTEAGTLQYDWFFDEAEASCVVRETYADSDAVLAHLGNVGDRIGRIAELGGGLEIEGFGTPTPELLEASTAFGVTIYAPFQLLSG